MWKTLVCGISAYGVWAVAGNEYVSNIVLFDVSGYPVTVQDGKIVACIMGALLLFIPLQAARNYHREYNDQLIPYVKERSYNWISALAFVGAVFGVIALAYRGV